MPSPGPLGRQCGEAHEPRLRLEPDVQRHIAAPAVRDCFEVRILPRDLETEAGSLIAVRQVDAAAEANAERTGADPADLEHSRLKQAADAEGPKAIWCQNQRGDLTLHQEGSAQLTAQGNAFVDVQRANRIAGDSQGAIELELLGHKQRLAEGLLAPSDQIDLE